MFRHYRKYSKSILFIFIICADIKDCSTTSINVGDIVNPNDANLNQNVIFRAKNLFRFNNNNEVIAYPDGACIINGSLQVAGGIGVWFGRNHPLNLSEKLPGVLNHNHAELSSISRAIERVKLTGLKRINIHTDSEYAINCITKWSAKWEENDWRKSLRRKVIYKEILLALKKQIKTMESVTWTHVRSHTGIRGNEEADKLAKAGAYM